MPKDRNHPMKAVLCQSYGTPDDLVLADLPVPQPARHEVRIKVKACGINFPDVLMIAGKYQIKPPMPFSPGAELAGSIDAVGEDVSDLTIGDRIVAVPGHGGLREFLCLPAAAVTRLPADAPFDVAAAFTLAYGTSFHALHDRANLRAGETLLVLGAAGGVGLAAVELGKLAGAHVIAAASSPEKLKLAKHYGADELINYSEEELKPAVKTLTNGRGVDVIYDPVGGALFDSCMRSVAWGGRILVVGFAAGEIPKVPTNLALLKGASIVGVFWGQHTMLEPKLHAKNMQTLAGLLQSGKLRPHISETFSLAESGRAIKRLASRQSTGKVVVEI